MSSQALTQTPASSLQLQRSSSQNALASQQPSQAANSISTPQQPSRAVGAASVQQQNGTPNARSPQQMLQRPSPAPSTPGKWEHPRMQEIVRRQHLRTFDQTNVQRILYSTAGLLLVTIVPGYLSTQLPRSLVLSVPAFFTLIAYALQLLLVANITVAMLPLLRNKDNMEDIPLTPQQRQLLNLPPMSRPATPQEQAAWVTPPRYSRNGTPTSTDSLMVNARGTPLSARGSPSGGFQSSTSSSLMYTGRVNIDSPRAGSPLAGRATDAGKSRRDSLGSGRGSPLAEKDVFGTPVGKSRASVGLNNKWLYDKGKTSPAPSGFLGSGWGTGSVFN